MSATTPQNGAGTLLKPTVQLGEETYTVVPQRIGRLKKRLGAELEGITDIDFDSGMQGFVVSAMDRAHAILKVFIPDLMPEFEFLGYRSQEAMDKDDLLDDGKEYGPSFPQIVDAFQVVMQVNRLDLFKHLGNLVSPDLLRAYINQQMATLMIGPEAAKESPTTSLPS